MTICINGLFKKKSELAASPLPSRGPKSGRKCDITPAFSGVPNEGDKIRIGCFTPAFLGAQKWAEMLRHPAFSGVPNKGDKIRIGCLTLAFSGAQNRKEMLHHPCILRGPQQKGTKSNHKKNEKRKNSFHCFHDVAWVPQAALPGVRTHDLSLAEPLLYPLGYGPSLTNLCTGVVLIFGPICFSSIIGLS